MTFCIRIARNRFLSSLINYKTKRMSFSTGIVNKNPFFVDFDANLLHADLVTDSARLIGDAKAQNVQMFVVPGSTLEDSVGSLELSKLDANILSTCGVHPYHAESNAFSEDTVAKLADMSTDASCLAIGECGLDYSPGFPDKSFQLVWFEHQVQLALECKKPLYFHVRAAHDDFISVLLKHGFTSSDSTDNASVQPPVPGVVHCFTGSVDELKQYLSFGFYIGLTGHIIQSLTNEQLLEQLELITLDRLVIETDAPYMGFKGCRKHDSAVDKKKKNQKYPNIPAALIQIAEHISTVSGWSLDSIAENTTANALRFFGVDRDSERFNM